MPEALDYRPPQPRDRAAPFVLAWAVAALVIAVPAGAIVTLFSGWFLPEDALRAVAGLATTVALGASAVFVTLRSKAGVAWTSLTPQGRLVRGVAMGLGALTCVAGPIALLAWMMFS